MQWKNSLSFWRWRNGCADWGFIQTRHYRNELRSFLERSYLEIQILLGNKVLWGGRGKGIKMPVRFSHSTHYQAVLRKNYAPVNSPATGYLCYTHKHTCSYPTQPYVNFRQTKRWNRESDVTVMDCTSEGSLQAHGFVCASCWSLPGLWSTGS